MKLKGLYEGMPASEHDNIMLSGDRVFVRTPEGTDEYLLGAEGEIRPIRSDKEIRRELAKIKAKLDKA